MKAAAKIEPGPGIAIVDVPTPEPTAGQVLVQVRYCGICGSDLPVYRWDGFQAKWADRLPRVMGHEFAGHVVALGPGTEGRGVEVGDAVAVEPGVTCGVCPACREGFRNLCQDRSLIGIDRDGAFAPFVAVPLENAFRLEPDVDLRHAAFLEVLALAQHAIERSHLEPSDRVLVLGAGPVALGAVALARLGGCEDVVVVGAPMDAHFRLPLAAELGATQTGLLSDAGSAATFDVVIEASGAASAIQAALSLCRTGGRVVAVGTPTATVEVDWYDLVMRAVTVVPIRARHDRHWTTAAALLMRVRLPERFFQVLELARAREAFDAAIAGHAVKVLIDPTERPS